MFVGKRVVTFGEEVVDFFPARIVNTAGGAVAIVFVPSLNTVFVTVGDGSFHLEALVKSKRNSMSEIKITLKTDAVELGCFQDGFGDTRIRDVEGFVDELYAALQAFGNRTLSVAFTSKIPNGCLFRCDIPHA